jgi:hypothetical protein
MRSELLLSLGPEALHAMHQAFDEAWRDIEGNFSENPIEVEDARTNLAKALLSIAADGPRDPSVLKQKALEHLALKYRARHADGRY